MNLIDLPNLLKKVRHIEIVRNVTQSEKIAALYALYTAQERDEESIDSLEIILKEFQQAGFKIRIDRAMVVAVTYYDHEVELYEE